MPRTVTIESLASATGYSEAAITNALFEIAKLARKRGAIVDEQAALEGLGQILAFAAACAEEHARHPQTSAETPADLQGGHEYP